MTSCATKLSDRERTVLMVTMPTLWPHWPFLPMVRRSRGHKELGLVFDARHFCDRTGYSATVFACNLFLLPPSLKEFLELPHETFDAAEELADADWRVD